MGGRPLLNGIECLTWSRWIPRASLLERRPFRLVSLALANKMARIAWAVMVRQEDYRKPLAAAA